MPLTIGLTGGIAAGKSEALKAFARLGAATLSSDAVVHELLESDELRRRLVERWGPDVAPGGKVNRAKIGEIVFADPEQLTWLEAQIHPLVQARTAEWLLSLPAETEVAVVDEREARQLTQGEKAERAEHVVENDGSVEDLERALSALLAKLKS